MDLIASLLDPSKVGQTVTVNGWVRTFRNNQFVAVNDGSCIQNLQLVLDRENADEALMKRLTTGAAISATGTLIASKGTGQATEVEVTQLEILGDSDPDEFPIQMKKHSMEFLREKAHLRFRTSTFGAIFRIRHAMTFAVHSFSTNAAFTTFTPPLLRHPMPKEQAKCFA